MGMTDTFQPFPFLLFTTSILLSKNLFMMKRNFVSRIFLSLLLMAAPFVAQAQTFAHYVGYGNKQNGIGLAANGMQRVAEVHYYVYLNSTSSYTPELPLTDYTGNGNGDESRGYFRWYDYKTDKAMSRLTAVGNLVSIRDASNVSRGLFLRSGSRNNYYYYTTSNSRHNTVGVTYTPPSNITDASWEGDDIACDVSSYIDYNDTGSASNTSTFTHEPTLSVRYIFHIRPAKQLAQEIKEDVATDVRKTINDTYEDHRRVVFGYLNTSSTLAMRLNLGVPSNYWFYPMTQSTHHVYYNNESNKITSADFGTTLYNASSVEWRIYDQSKSKYRVLNSSSTSKFQEVSLSDVNGKSDWKNLSNSSTSAPADITVGEKFYLVALAKSGSYSCPIVNAEVVMNTDYPQTADEMRADRQITYMDEHYKQMMKPISFDNENPDQTFDAPTSSNNMAQLPPTDWSKCSYAYTYRYLLDNKYGRSGRYGDGTLGSWSYMPLHGEFCFYKSLNVSGLSDASNKYDSWNKVNNNSSLPLYDKTYYRTGGKQAGYFLYFDASDESRQVVSADFEASFCVGSRIYFSAAVADGTNGSIKPRIAFKLYGLEKDADGNVTRQQLLQTFASGDFATNTIQSNYRAGQWYQVYGKFVLRDDDGAENFTDFRMSIDNMCAGTAGADYAVDDIHLYARLAQIDVLQNKAVCPDQANGTDSPTDLIYQIRSDYESIQTLSGVNSTTGDGKLFYRFCSSDDGKPITLDYDGDGQPDDYGTAIIPASYDATRTLSAADQSVKMFSKDKNGDIYLVLANRHYNLSMGKNYYVSVAYPSATDADVPGDWGRQTDVCSTYSENFSVVQQNVIVSDATGNIQTTLRVSCDGNYTPSVDLVAKLQTVDQIVGGSTSIENVPFDWFVSEKDKDNDLTTITNLLEAIQDYRSHYPTATSLQYAYRNTNATYYNLLKTYVDSKRLVLAASSSLKGITFTAGKYVIAAIPIGTTITDGDLQYEICSDPLYVTLRVVEDGPKLVLGDTKVVYPTDGRNLRIGLPQINAMLAKSGSLTLPIYSLSSSSTSSTSVSKVNFTDTNVYISNTNDPSIDLSTTPVLGSLVETTATSSTTKLQMKFNAATAALLHEGYWYELNFQCELPTSSSTISCPGLVYITLKVVPEYLTWNSLLSDRLNSNWNKDTNWLRSSASELYRTDGSYTDYDTSAGFSRSAAYSPMKFSKVTIPAQIGKVYPDLGNIVTSKNNIISDLTNSKGEDADDDVVYDLAVKWNTATADGSDDGAGNFTCENYYANACDQIYLKPGAELRDQCFLLYNKAWMEKEMLPNNWYAFSSPLRTVYAGDFYVPYNTNGQQTTPAFEPITFADDAQVQYNRLRYPFYQKNWDKSGTEVLDNTQYEAYDYLNGTITVPTDIDLSTLYWSHSYNDVTVPYSVSATTGVPGQGFAICAGDNYLPADQSQHTLLRFPKADTEFTYALSGTPKTATVDRTNNYRFVIDYDNSASATSTIQVQLENATANNPYYLVGNPYVATLSAFYLLKANTQLDRKVWYIENGAMKSFDLTDSDTYDKKNDVLISPTQAFFVKLNDTSKKYVTFNSSMTVDRYLIGGYTTSTDDVTDNSFVISATPMQSSLTTSAVSTDALSASQQKLQCSDNAQAGATRVLFNDNATADYAESEDVELLRSDLVTRPVVYTVASDQLVTLNQLPRTSLQWLPVGVITPTAQQVQLTLNGVKAAQRKLYLYDAQQSNFTLLTDNAPVLVQSNAYGRYFLTFHADATAVSNAQSASSTIRCYAPQPGLLLISAPTALSGEATIYSADGKLQAKRQLTQSTERFTLPTGVYVVSLNGQSYKVSVK